MIGKIFRLRGGTEENQAVGWMHWNINREDHIRAWWYAPQWLKDRDLQGASVQVIHQLPFSGRRHQHAMIRFRIGEEPTFSFSIGIPYLFAVFFGIDHRCGYRLMEHFGKSSDMGAKYEGREIGLSWFEDTLNWDLWVCTSGWTNKRPKWRDGSFTPIDFLLGRPKYEAHERGVPHRHTVYMPEGEYPVTVTFEDCTWKRPCWPWAKRLVRAEVKPDFPIPCPGKGENSWDCDEDATHAMNCVADVPHEAVEILRRSVMRDRLRRAGTKWRPEKGPYGKGSPHLI